MKIRQIMILIVALVMFSVACEQKKPEGGIEILRDPVFGFNLGESKQDLFKRAQGKVAWQQLPEGNKWHYRGELYRLDGPLDGSTGIDHIRLTFLDGYLMEVIAYYSDNSRSNLGKLKRELEKRYGGTMTAPDGTVEMTYKTYRLPGPGRSITLRRITKHDGIELYVQYLHNELHARLIKRKLDMQSHVDGDGDPYGGTRRPMAGIGHDIGAPPIRASRPR